VTVLDRAKIALPFFRGALLLGNPWKPTTVLAADAATP
jgi:hypothetical protein